MIGDVMTKKCTYCKDKREEGNVILGPVLPNRLQTRFCDEFCLDLWTKAKEAKKLPKLTTSVKCIIPLSQAERDYQGGYVE